jgi:hypothetical protein
VPLPTQSRPDANYGGFAVERLSHKPREALDSGGWLGQKLAVVNLQQSNVRPAGELAANAFELSAVGFDELMFVKGSAGTAMAGEHRFL